MRLFSKNIGKIALLATYVGAIGLVTGIGFTPAITQGGTLGDTLYPKIEGCPINKRFDNWGKLIKDGTSFTDFYENWKDLFSRNMCQQTDILSLQRRIEAAQDQLRRKVFACQTGGLDVLSTKIHEMQFELEYIRNVADTDEENPSPASDTDTSEAKQPNSAAKISQLMQDSSLIRNGVISADRFPSLFSAMQDKYAARIPDYLNCKNPSWKNLSDAWEAFINNGMGTKKATEDLTKFAQTQFKVAIEIPPMQFGKFFKGLLTVRLNGVTPEQGFKNIYNTLTQKTGQKSVGGTPPNSWDFLDAVNQESSRFDSDEALAKRQSYYEGLYRYAADAGSEKLVQEIKKTNTVLNDSIKVMSAVQSSTACVASRQCDGK